MCIKFLTGFQLGSNKEMELNKSLKHNIYGEYGSLRDIFYDLKHEFSRKHWVDLQNIFL